MVKAAMEEIPFEVAIISGNSVFGTENVFCPEVILIDMIVVRYIEVL